MKTLIALIMLTAIYILPINAFAEPIELITKIATLIQPSNPDVALKLNQIAEEGTQAPEGSHGNQEQLETLNIALSIIKNSSPALAEQLEDLIVDIELGM